MSRTLEAVSNANAADAADFDKGDLPMPPGRHFAILTCMDARLDPAEYAGLDRGELRRLADHQGQRAERRRGCSAHPPASACSGRDPDLR
jgi:carbonic anhydrase